MHGIYTLNGGGTQLGGDVALFIIIFTVGYLAMVVRDIFLCGLYVYATEGVVPGGFDPELTEHAWRVKKRK